MESSATQLITNVKVAIKAVKHVQDLHPKIANHVIQIHTWMLILNSAFPSVLINIMKIFQIIYVKNVTRIA